MVSKWIYIVTPLIVLIGFVTGAGVYVFPTTFLPGVDFSSEPTRVLAHLWATRQIAIALVIGYNLVRRSNPALQTGLLVYCSVTFLDIFIGIINGDVGLAAISAVLCVLSFAIIRSLRKSDNV